MTGARSDRSRYLVRFLAAALLALPCSSGCAPSTKAPATTASMRRGRYGDAELQHRGHGLRGLCRVGHVCTEGNSWRQIGRGVARSEKGYPCRQHRRGDGGQGRGSRETRRIQGPADLRTAVRQLAMSPAGRQNDMRTAGDGIVLNQYLRLIDVSQHVCRKHITGRTYRRKSSPVQQD